jgi:gluconokinase
MKPAILALDLGTSSTRAAVYDAAGERFLETTAQFAYPLQTDADGRAELDPRTIEKAVERAVEKTLRAWRRKKGGPLVAVGVSCFWHSLLGLDARGRPVTPIYTWADSRCRHDAEKLRRRSGERAIHTRTGCMARASFWPAKLLWLRRTQPQLFRRVARWVSPAEWIQQRWCGVATCSFSMASGTGLLDGHMLRRDRRLLARCGVDAAKLNPLSDEPGRITAARARRFPALAGAAWYPALGDGAASNLGSGATRPGFAAINVGTSAALRVIVEDARAKRRGPLAPFGLFAYRVDARRRLVGGAVSNAGNLRAWALRELKLPRDPARLESLLRARTGPAEELTLLPFWMAERAPTWPEEMPSAVIGITQATSALDLLQALQEATYHRLAQIADEVAKTARRPLKCIVSGGIRHSPEALQRLANVLARPVYVSHEPEASLRGAACFALERLGQLPKAPKFAGVIRPDRAASRAYLRARQRQIRLEEEMRKRSAR